LTAGIFWEGLEAEEEMVAHEFFGQLCGVFQSVG
jgi:hypothetical protein